jgi:hypothetical protein
VAYSAENLTRSTLLANSVRVAGASAERRQGLLGVKELRPGEGLWIGPCEAIHTVGMKWPIDVVFLDSDRRVCKVKPALRPWRIVICLAAAAVLELPEGALTISGTKVGDLLAFHPSSN